MIENKKYYICQINSSKAYQFTCQYHYSGVGFKKAILNLGIFRKEDNLLVGVLQWGCSFQEKINLSRFVKEAIKKEEYLELNRFCMADSEGANSESQAISLGIKWIKKNWPHIRLLVSYAGRKEGNYGYIYQATNWEYLGYFISTGFWSVDGNEKHTMTLWCAYDKSQSKLSFEQWLCTVYQDVRKTWTKQFIYIQRLDKTLTATTPQEQYPKPVTDFPIKTKEKILKQNDDIFNNPIKDNNKNYPLFYYEQDKYLFSKRTLKRRGEIKDKIFIMYNSYGQYEVTSKKINDLANDLLLITGIRKALKTGKIYKNKYFREYDVDIEIPQEIEVPFVCLIDEIPFPTYAEAARYLGVSRQCVQQASKRNAKAVAAKEVTWNII